MQKRLIFFSGISGAIAVALGAMAAHFLKSKINGGLITELNLQTFETASKYQMYHSLAILLISLLSDKFHFKLIIKAGYCFMIGIVLFSGSLYLISTAKLIGLTSIKWLGPITPIGGFFFITGWLLLAFAGFKKDK